MPAVATHCRQGRLELERSDLHCMWEPQWCVSDLLFYHMWYNYPEPIKHLLRAEQSLLTVASASVTRSHPACRVPCRSGHVHTGHIHHTSRPSSLGRPQSAAPEFCWLSWETKLFLIEFFSLWNCLLPCYCIWDPLEKGEIVFFFFFFELYDLKGRGQKILRSFTIFSWYF